MILVVGEILFMTDVEVKMTGHSKIGLLGKKSNVRIVPKYYSYDLI